MARGSRRYADINACVGVPDTAPDTAIPNSQARAGGVAVTRATDIDAGCNFEARSGQVCPDPDVAVEKRSAFNDEALRSPLDGAGGRAGVAGGRGAVAPVRRRIAAVDLNM